MITGGFSAKNLVIHRCACGKCEKAGKNAFILVENLIKKHLFAVDKCLPSVQSVGNVGAKLRTKMAICQRFSSLAP
jgi:hypothetical protein